MEAWAQKLKLLPTEPGVYLMKNAAGKIIYVGKAVNLRSRVSSYFQDPAALQPRIRRLVEQIADFEFLVTRSEVEALTLEFTLIQRHRPPYNVKFRDDKRYPYICILTRDPYPPLMTLRRPTPEGRCFGPQPSSRAMWQTIKLLRQVFKLRFARKYALRSCAGRPWQSGGPRLTRACLDHHLGLCLGPCVEGGASREEYAAAVKSAIEFLEGRSDALLRRLNKEMTDAAGEMRYEAAAKLRDLIAAVEQVTSQQTVVSEKPEELDAIALALGQDLASVTVFLVREGRLIGQNHFMLEGISGLEEKAVLEEFVKAHYQRTGAVPPQVLLATAIDDRESVRQLLEEKRGGRVSITLPQRGKKRELVALAEENARHYLTEALGKEGSVRRRAEEALLELRAALQLPVPPQRIECYDISNLFGQQAVGSMVVFESGQVKKTDYRRFKIRRKEGQPDDFAMMGEVLERRLRAGLAEQERFLPLPDLILVDGGKGQLNVALRVLRNLGLTIPVLGLAKEFEELFIEGRAEPVRLPRNSRPLHLLQAIRDEAHRFAIAYHRSLRDKAATASILENIPGIGKKRREILLKTFGSLEGIRRARPEAVAATPGMTKAAAEALLTNLRASEAGKDEN